MSGKKLGFGLMRLPSLDPNDPGKIDIEQVKKMVDTFIERGFTYFDTAWMYCAFKSENAVKEFQLRNNMNMDGKVGANTWNVLYAKYTAKHGLAVPYPGIVMRTGMSGGTIRLIQQKLNTLGEKIGTDGKFGSRTADAVQRFQRRNGLNADGAVGKATWEKLFPAS